MIYLICYKELDDVNHDLSDLLPRTRWSTSLSIWSICYKEVNDLDHDLSDMSVTKNYIFRSWCISSICYKELDDLDTSWSIDVSAWCITRNDPDHDISDGSH